MLKSKILNPGSDKLSLGVSVYREGAYAHVSVFVCRPLGVPVSPSYTQLDYHPLTTLTVKAQADERCERLYAYDIRFLDRFGYGLRELERMGRVAKEINRKLDRLDDKFGHVSGFADSMVRLATVLGINELAVRSGSSLWQRVTGMPAMKYLLQEAEREAVQLAKGESVA